MKSKSLWLLTTQNDIIISFFYIYHHPLKHLGKPFWFFEKSGTGLVLSMITNTPSYEWTTHDSTSVSWGTFQTETLTRNSSRMKNLALVTLGSSPGSGVAVRNDTVKRWNLRGAAVEAQVYAHWGTALTFIWYGVASIFRKVVFDFGFSS